MSSLLLQLYCWWNDHKTTMNESTVAEVEIIDFEYAVT